MKHLKILASFAFAFGIGLGASAPSHAVIAKCVLDSACYNDCISGLGNASVCRRACCV